MDDVTPEGEELRAEKYTAKDRDEMAGKEAMPDGSYPIKDQEDLENAIHAVGRGSADHDAIRKHIIARAKAIGHSDMIPDNWGADGSLAQTNGALLALLGASRRRKERRRAVPLMPEVRHWSTTGLELRSAAGGGDVIAISGEPIVYNQPYSVRDMFGEFQETMAPGVAASALANGADCRFLFNHDGLPLARTTSGTLTLEDTDRGLRFTANLDARQQLANDLAIAIERGDVTQMSCGFVVADDDWDEGMENRTIYRFADLLDVSAVTYPASPTTSIQIAQRMALEIPVESRARLRKLTVDLRAGKVLSKDNQDKLTDAVTTLHSVLEGAGVDTQALVGTQDAEDGSTDGDGDGQEVTPGGIGQDASGRSVPDTAAERREQSLSFSDQQAAVYQALVEHLSSSDPDHGADLWIVDMGSDWVVYEDFDASGARMFRLSYTTGEDGAVSFTGDPVAVNVVTSYEPAAAPAEDEPSQKSSRAAWLRLELEARKRRRPSA